MKKIFLILLTVLTAFCFVACGGDESDSTSESTSVSQSIPSSQESESVSKPNVQESESESAPSVHTHDYVKHDALAPDCDVDGNEEYYTCSGCEVIFDAEKNVINAIPTISARHAFEFKQGTDGTCATKGTEAHYECTACHKLFDLAKNQIDAVVEGDYDFANHEAEQVIIVKTNPSKTVYKVGEIFDPSGLVVVCKCSACEGEIVDNSFLTYEYQTVGATAFSMGDTAIRVAMGELTVDVLVTVEKQTVTISGVLESYDTICATAPVIEAVPSNTALDLIITYYDAENNPVNPVDFVAGSVYTAKVAVESTDIIEGAEVTATVNVDHSYGLVIDEATDKCEFACICGDKKDFYVLTNQEVYVDDQDMSIDLSELIVGTDDVNVVAIKQVKDGDRVDIQGTNEGLVYTFDYDLYEKHNPAKLTLFITLEVEGEVLDITLTAKYVTIIRDAEDLKKLAYEGGADNQTGTAMTGLFVLERDIDATGLNLKASSHAFQAGVGFCGVFDGQGHTISNLTVPAWSNGLFGAIGAGAVIKDVTFENVIVPVEVTSDNGTYVFAYAIRNATLSNVSVSFSIDSLGFKLACEINDTVIDNVNVYTAKGHDASFAVNKGENGSGDISYEYMPVATVTFDTDGGSEIAPIEVTVGKRVVISELPTKAPNGDEEYMFDGWLLNGVPYDINTPVTEDIVLKANWVIVEVSPFGEILVNAKTQFVERWDYGGTFTASTVQDEVYGNVMVMPVGSVCEQGFKNPVLDTTGFERVCFYIFNPCAHQVRLNVHGNSSWGAMTVMLEARKWALIEINASLFNENNAGWVGFIIQDPDAVSVAGEWKISSFFGLKVGEEAIKAVNTVLVDAKAQAVMKWDYGNEITVTNSTDATYGDVMVVTFDAIVEQSFRNPTMTTEDFDTVYFYIYNPCANEMRLIVCGNSTWEAKKVMLGAQGWTKIELDAALFNENDAGWVGFIIQDPNAVSVAGEWKISSFYGANTNA